MVTCLYRAETGARFLSRLEGAADRHGVSGAGTAGPLAAGSAIRGSGATVAFRKETLRGIGGFEAVRRHIGDDYQLGKHIASRGTEVQISAATVTTVLPPGGGWRSVWRRHLRWSRTIRMQRPLGHAGLFVSFGAFWALAALVLSPEALWPLAIPAFALKLAAAARSSAQVASTERRKQLWLLPVSDLCALAVWLWSYFGCTVDWAGRRIHLGRDGLIRGRMRAPESRSQLIQAKRSAETAERYSYHSAGSSPGSGSILPASIVQEAGASVICPLTWSRGTPPIATNRSRRPSRMRRRMSGGRPGTIPPGDEERRVVTNDAGPVGVSDLPAPVRLEKRDLHETPRRGRNPRNARR